MALDTAPAPSNAADAASDAADAAAIPATRHLVEHLSLSTVDDWVRACGARSLAPAPPQSRPAAAVRGRDSTDVLADVVDRVKVEPA